jgi:RNA polymerase sigma-70 factor, ECF subfamily
VTKQSIRCPRRRPPPRESREQKTVALRRLERGRGFLNGLLDSCIPTEEDSTAWPAENGCEKENSLDCVQDAFHTFLLLPQARQLVESNDDSIKLLSVLVRNHARNRRRRHKIARPHDSDDEALALLTAEAVPVDELMARAQECALMIGCLDHLGTLQRAVVSLRMLDEVGGEDVAAMLGLPPSHVAVLLHRAKLNLRSRMLSAGYRP